MKEVTKASRGFLRPYGMTVEISNEGKYLLFALAFVSGFAVSHILDRLEALAKKIFQVDLEVGAREE